MFEGCLRGVRVLEAPPPTQRQPRDRLVVSLATKAVQALHMRLAEQTVAAAVPDAFHDACQAAEEAGAVRDACRCGSRRGVGESRAL